MSSDKSSTIGTVNFTANEIKILSIAWQCMENEPKIDYAKMAQLGGWTKGSASVLFGSVRRKIRTASGSLPATTKSPSAGTTPKTPRTPKRKAVEAIDPNGDADGSPSPAKRGRSGGRKAKPKKNTGSEDDDEYASAKIIKKEVDGLEEDAEAIFRGNGYASFVDNSGLFADAEGDI